MRKILRPVCLLLILMCTFACAEEALRGYDAREGYVYLTLGTFPQTKEGAELPILWRVLSVQDSRALLLSEHVLEARRIHGDYDEYANKPTNQKKPGFDGDFTQTEMSQYLRGDFTAHFTPEEMALITPDEAMGLFFLLTSEDLKNKDYGFDSNQSRKAWATEYAIANGVFVYRAARGSHSPYWSCTQSTTNIQGARCIKSQGELGYINVITENLGLRPACWLDLAQVHIQSGTGTKDDPYLLSPGALPDATVAANPS
ncbi:MAG: DUF6273 domain-containing protein [Clostridiales bacterium]|nr:DUF6273 domain-containing protein [Clostridiales bacterium]